MDDLQFDKAEYSGPSGAGNCAQCGRGIGETYWQANGHNVCPECAALFGKIQQAPERSLMIRGALFAFGAALVCAIGYAAILIITKYDLALVSIAVGWLVGKAARQGTGGLGGRPVQVLAVLATYIAISGSMFFQILYSFWQQGKMVSSMFGYVYLFGFSLGKPLLELQEGFSGLIGIAILFFGLQQAWQQTVGPRVELAGPYTAEAAQQG